MMMLEVIKQVIMLSKLDLLMNYLKLKVLLLLIDSRELKNKSDMPRL